MKRFFDERALGMDKMPFWKDGVLETEDYGRFGPPSPMPCNDIRLLIALSG